MAAQPLSQSPAAGIAKLLPNVPFPLAPPGQQSSHHCTFWMELGFGRPPQSCAAPALLWVLVEVCIPGGGEGVLGIWGESERASERAKGVLGFEWRRRHWMGGWRWGLGSSGVGMGRFWGEGI